MAEESGSRPWMWPAEWAVSHSFWREVATRTVAGILTLVFLGIPGVIYAVTFGALTAEQGWLIGIGLGMVVALIALYVIFLALSKAIARGAVARELSRAASGDQSIRIQRVQKIAQASAVAASVISTALAGTAAYAAFEWISGR